ncbi:MAG: acyl carrier protein [Anaerolineales bacterium]
MALTDDVLDLLRRYIAAQYLKLPAESLRPGQALISSGLVDSFNLVDLALYVEQAFGVRIDDTELNAETFDTVEQLAMLIHSRQ